MKLGAWRFLLGWSGWRQLMNDETGGPFQIVELERHGPRLLTVRLELAERGATISHRDVARPIYLDLSEREAAALVKALQARLEQLSPARLPAK